MVGHSDAHRLAKLPANRTRILILPVRIESVDADGAWPIANPVDLDLHREIGPPAEPSSDVPFELTVSDDDAIVPRGAHLVSPGDQIARGFDETATRMSSQISLTSPKQ